MILVILKLQPETNLRIIIFVLSFYCNKSKIINYFLNEYNKMDFPLNHLLTIFFSKEQDHERMNDELKFIRSCRQSFP
jgi:hypothetical protein